MVLLLLLFGRNGNPYKGFNYRLLIIRGLNGSLAFLTIAAAISMLPLSTAMVIFYTYPAFAAFLAIWLYGDRLRAADGACILLVVFGACLLFEFQFSGRPLGEFLALGGAMLFGLTVTLIRSLRRQNGPVVIYLYFCSMGMLVTLPAYLRNPRLPETGMDWLLCLAMVVSSTAAQVSMNQGFFYCRSWEGGVFMTTEAVFSVLVGVFLLQEAVSWRLFAGGGMILFGVAALSVFSARRAAHAPDTAFPHEAISEGRKDKTPHASRK